MGMPGVLSWARRLARLPVVSASVSPPSATVSGFSDNVDLAGGEGMESLVLVRLSGDGGGEREKFPLEIRLEDYPGGFSSSIGHCMRDLEALWIDQPASLALRGSGQKTGSAVDWRRYTVAAFCLYARWRGELSLSAMETTTARGVRGPGNIDDIPHGR